MKATLIGLVFAFAAASASAQYPPSPYTPCMPRPTAPDACGPGTYNTGPYGMVYGPNYNVHPPFPPFNGMLPTPPWYTPPAAGPNPGALVPEFPSHPYCRSPRDFFMYPQDRDR